MELTHLVNEEAEESRSLRDLRRHPTFRPDDAVRVLTALANGMRITAVGQDAGMPDYWVINDWRNRYPAFDELVVQASQAGADALMFECLPIADRIGEWANVGTADRALSIQVREKLAKVLHRKKYDPATRVEVSAGPGQADDLSDDALAAIARRSGSIDSTAVTVTVGASDGDGDGSGS